MSETVAQPGAQHTAPQDASTVMLVRDGAAGPEIFLQRRVSGMAFAAGVTVFPGGGVYPADAEAEIDWAGPEPEWWGAEFGIDGPRAQALVCAAVRETFEECGVLLAGPTAGSVVSETGVYHEARGQLERRELSFGEFLAREQLVLRTDLLRPWANWITPVVQQRRYDTRFFVAVLPAGQHADGATREAAQVSWSTPAQALERWKAGEDILMPPTWSQLDALSRFDSTAAILAGAPVIEPIVPVLETVDGQPRLVFPQQERYYAEGPQHPIGR